MILTILQVSLPAGNIFGITAATPENPDSFEIFKFAVQSSQSGESIPVQQPINQQQQQQQQPIVERDTAQNTHFANLDSRIQVLSHATNDIVRELGNQNTKSEAQHAELLKRLDQASAFDARLQRIEQALQTIQRDLEGKDYRDRFAQLQETLKSSHLSLSENLQGHFLDGEIPYIQITICISGFSTNKSPQQPSQLLHLAWASSSSSSSPSKCSSPCHTLSTSVVAQTCLRNSSRRFLDLVLRNSSGWTNTSSTL